jgi:hypothetical protein
MKNTWEQEKKKEERTEVETKDHTRKCKTYNGDPRSLGYQRN